MRKTHCLIFLLCQSNVWASCNIGQSIDVWWQGYWYPSTVLDTDGINCFVQYDGYDQVEWIEPDRIRYVDFSAELPAGTPVMVNWQGEWYPATVLKSRGARYYINYDGWGANFDEWVGPDRIRLKE